MGVGVYKSANISGGKAGAGAADPICSISKVSWD